ncbi:MAG: DNA methylase [Clostridiales bacterium]|nr:DNA methylase [Clostridiales bacterium]
MGNEEKTYVAIDLKSFYASVECVERGLDPMSVNLVVADESRTAKTICLAVSPSLKKYGIPGRARLYEVIKRVKDINEARRLASPQRKLEGSSCDSRELSEHPEYALDYLVVPPHMRKYMEKSAQIYNVYLKYVSEEDMHVYSVDEVFIDVTKYLKLYKISARELTMKIILDVLNTTGITATAGIGTNMYLCKIALDIGAKHIPADENGVRIAELDEMSYRRLLWSHRPLTDFWRIGGGYAKKLEAHNMYTMGDVARCSVSNEDLLYRLFGVNAELLIDHAWGWEPCTIQQIKAYKPSVKSLSTGQVLQTPYPIDKARLVTREMADLLVLDLVEKGLTTSQIVLTVGYDVENLTDTRISNKYKGEIVCDRYGRRIPKHAHSSINLNCHTSSSAKILAAVGELFDSIVNPLLLVRRITVVANDILEESCVSENEMYEQLDFFSCGNEDDKKRQQKKIFEKKEKSLQRAMIHVKNKFGRNAILKGMNLEEGATAIERNSQIGGHKE